MTLSPIHAIVSICRRTVELIRWKQTHRWALDRLPIGIPELRVLLVLENVIMVSVYFVKYLNYADALSPLLNERYIYLYPQPIDGVIET